MLCLVTVQVCVVVTEALGFCGKKINWHCGVKKVRRPYRWPVDLVFEIINGRVLL